MPKIPRLTYAEIFRQINDGKDTNERLSLLKLHNHPHMRDLFNLMFNPDVKFLLPEGTPPFKDLSKEADVNLFVYGLRQDFRKVFIFTNNGNYVNLNPRKREQVFIDFLGAIHPDDAALICSIKDKNWSYENITPELVTMIYPEYKSKWVNPQRKTEGTTEKEEAADLPILEKLTAPIKKKVTKKKTHHGKVIQEKQV